MENQGEIFAGNLSACEVESQRRSGSLEAPFARNLLTTLDGDAGDRSGRFHRGVQDDRQEPVGLVRVGQRVSEQRDDLPDVPATRSGSTPPRQQVQPSYCDGECCERRERRQDQPEGSRERAVTD